jgi:hypothetical protein
VTLIAGRQYDPRLPTAGPEVDSRLQPGSVVEGPRANYSDRVRHSCARAWHAADPYAEVWTDQATLDASAVCHGLDYSCFA